MTDLPTIIGRRLARNNRGMTLAQVAERTGVTLQQVQKYECASNTVSVEKFIQLARAMDTTAADLLGGL